MSYRIVAGDEVDVENEVQELLSAGFQLHGSVQVMTLPNSKFLHYSQPMYHPQPNLIKQLRLTWNATGEERNVRVVVVHNSRLLELFLTNSIRLQNENRSRWMHCKVLGDNITEDIFVKDERYAFNKLNIEQGLHMGDAEGGRRHRTSRRK